MRGSLALSAASLAASVLAAPGQIRARQTDTPTVNLGYEIHSATINSTGNYYNFSNIPYADQPVGDLRFQKTTLPTGNSSEVNDGSTNVICMQGLPQWIIDTQAASFGIDSATMTAILYATADQTESCLMLDVFVPTEVFETGSAAEAPVLLWIHGGGFTSGSKTSSGSPAGLLARSKLSNETGAIVVTINYRLGMFGWLAGGDSNLTPNLGLYDQRLAFEWVQKYISLFGGSPDKVTVIGESAGASSILHHITAFGGAEAAPFARAAPFSPAFQINMNFTDTYERTLTIASSVAGASIESATSLSALTSDQLRQINWAVVLGSGTGKFSFGPGVDGDFVPKLPQVLLAEGKFDSSISLMASHTSNESVPFVPATIQTADALASYAASSFPEASNKTINTMLTEIYPDVLDGTYPWTTEFSRVVQMASDVNFACATRYMATAFGNNSYNLVFAYPPGYHATDVPYIFFNGDTTTSNMGLPVNPTLAYALQDYIVNFAMSGNPNVGASVEWPIYGAEASVLELKDAGLTTGTDDMANTRCSWIQQAMIDGLL